VGRTRLIGQNQMLPVDSVQAHFVAAQGREPSPLHNGKSEPLSGGIIALALVSGITVIATLLMTLTTALSFSWPDVWFRWLALFLAAAVLLAQLGNLSLSRIASTLGVVCGAVPSLVIAAQHEVDHWDDFMTWLSNALYIWKFGTFPTPSAPSVASVWPGYPPGSSIVLASIWSVAGHVVETAGPVLNVACLMILPGLVLRILVSRPQSLLGSLVFGASLGLMATVLNVGLDWHWVLSSLPDTATLVAFAAAFLLGSEALFLADDTSRSRLAALALILALTTNLKQTGVVLVILLILALLIMRWTCIETEKRQFRRHILILAVVCFPSLAVWMCWQVYRTTIFPANAFGFLPLADWHFFLLPDLLLAIVRSMAEHWVFFVLMAIVVIRGWYVIGNRWIGVNRAIMSPADRLAAVFALIETGYTGFLIVCYLGAFAEDEVLRAAEWFRYQAQIGGAGLLVAIALTNERLPQRVPVAVAWAAFALVLAMALIILPAPGVYPGQAVYDHPELQQVREIGKDAGEAIAQAGEPVTVELVNDDEFLANLIVRYEIWARSPRLVREIIWTSATGEDEIADLLATGDRPASSVVALEKHDGVHCAVLAKASLAKLLGPTRDAAPCLALLSRITKVMGRR